MKYPIYALFIAILCTTPLVALDRTGTVASHRGYPKFIIGLRNETERYLNQREADMILDTEELRQKNLTAHAEELTDLDRNSYLALERTINNVFRTVDNLFIRGAEHLDSTNASVKQKAEFIDQMKKLARKEVDKVLKKAPLIMRNNQSNVDF